MHAFRCYIFAARIACDSGPTCSLYSGCMNALLKQTTEPRRQTVASVHVHVSYMSSSFRLSVCLSVTFVHPTRAIEIFGYISTPFGTLAICWHAGKTLRRSSLGNPSVGEINTRGVAEYSDFGPMERYISETVQDRS